jgi:hypothetical protein
MRFSRARYVTLCQQSLVTAAVLAVGVSAAGVKTLDIVPQPGNFAGARNMAPGGVPQDALAQRVEKPPSKTEVDAAPVTPRVQEVRVTGISDKTPGATADRGANRRSTTKTPSKTPSTTPSATPTPEKAPTTKRLVALSDPTPVRGYATVGVTWKHGVQYAEDNVAVQVRTETNGAWSDWMDAAYHDEHGPDGGSAEGAARKERPGTDALVIGDVDRVQMRAETTDGTTPPDLKLAVIDPGTGTMVKQSPAIDTATLPAPEGAPQASGPIDAQDTVALSAMKVAAKPYIYSRAQWGANERLREQSRPSMGTVKAGFIHHTVNANSYTSEQVPALLRGIYAYHTQSRGWRDIGYNYLVDRFGRIWEGRYGGVGSPVVGAHTLGYNEVSFAMSAIGNYDIAAPPQAVLSAYARLFAWKLSLYNIPADAPRVYVKNRWLAAINGHRDVGQTACPGRYLYAKLPYIRTLARSVQNGAQTGTTPPPPPPPAPPPPPPDPDVFTSPIQTPRPATSQPAGLVFPRSLNLWGDSNPDLVLKARNGVVHVFPTGGQTGFRAPVSTNGTWSAKDQIVAVGDVTGDGRGDVLARVRSNKMTWIYRGDGAGHVTAPIGGTIRFRYANMITAAGDWNRDGRNDVLMRDAKSGWLWMVPGLGDGTFGTPVLLSKSWRNLTATAVAGDLTADGRPDIVAIHRNGYVYVAAQTTTGGLTGFSRRQHVGTQYNALVGGARDMTGDGYGDVVLRSARNGQVLILPGKRGSFGGALGPFDEAKGLARLSAGQMVGGAQPDLVGVDGAGKLLVVANNGLVNIRGPLSSTLTSADATQVLNAGDWNMDGRGDLITRQTAGDSLVLRTGLGNGQFGTGTVMSRGWKTFTHLAAVGDVTGDKRPDLVGRTKTGRTTVFPGNGARGFTAPRVASNFMKSYNQVGDGSWKPQLFPSSAYVGSGGAFVPFMGTGAGELPGYDWVIGPGDVDGDSHNDLVVRDARGTLWLLPGTTNGHGTRRLIATGFGGYSLGG